MSVDAWGRPTWATPVGAPVISALFSVGANAKFLNIGYFTDTIPILHTIYSDSLGIRSMYSSTGTILSKCFHTSSSECSEVLIFVYGSSPLCFAEFFVRFAAIYPVFAVSADGCLRLGRSACSVRAGSNGFLLRLPMAVVDDCCWLVGFSIRYSLGLIPTLRGVLLQRLRSCIHRGLCVLSNRIWVPWGATCWDWSALHPILREATQGVSVLRCGYRYGPSRCLLRLT